MPETSDAPGLSGLSPEAWLQAIDELGEARGYFEPLGPAHSAIFTDEGPVLLVTFETRADVRARPAAEPLGWALAAPGNWSQLTILAHEEGGWFRDRRVYGYFDRLVDDGFFEDFDRVIFYGAGMCGYAATAFSVAAPGCTVIAAAPQATLEPLRAGWDHRFPLARRRDFSGRYGFAPRMVEAADRAFVLFDPEVEADAMHAAMFTCINTHLIRMRNFGPDIGTDLQKLELLPELLQQAATPQGLTPQDVYRALRARGSYLPYLRNFLSRLEAQGRWWRLAKAARLLVDRFRGRRFTRIRDTAVQKLGDRGQTLPPPLVRSRGTDAGRGSEAATG